MEENKVIKEEKIDRGIDAFVLSIISIFTIMFWYLCLPLNIYALTRSVTANRKSGSKLAKSAFIIALISLTIHVVIYSQVVLLVYLENII